MTDIDDLITTRTDLAALPVETQKAFVSLIISTFCEWRDLYDKHGPASRSYHLIRTYGEYQGMEKLLGYLTGHRWHIFQDLMAERDGIPDVYDGLAHMRLVEKLRRRWAGEASS